MWLRGALVSWNLSCAPVGVAVCRKHTDGVSSMPILLRVGVILKWFLFAVCGGSISTLSMLRRVTHAVALQLAGQVALPCKTWSCNHTSCIACIDCFGLKARSLMLLWLRVVLAVA